MDTRRSRIALSVALGAAVLSACAQPGPASRPGGRPGELSPILRRMVESSGRLKYTGARTVEFRLNGERSRNVEFITVDGKNLRVEFAEGSPSFGKIIVENPRGRFQFDPSKNEIEQVPPQRDELVGRLRGLIMGPRKTKILEAPGGAIAGRSTTAVTFSDPRGNPVQKIWIDTETGLPLKRDVFDPSGSRVGSYEFTRINYRPNIRPEDFEIRRRGAKVVAPSDRAKKASVTLGFESWGLGGAAELVNARAIGEKQDTLMLAYRVNGTRVSLFQTRGDVNAGRLRKFGGDRLTSYRWSAHGSTFVLVGSLPEDQLKRLAGTLTPLK